MNDWFADGALAEYCTTQANWLAPKPQRLTHAEAASVPISALTAWQGLYDRGRLKRGERVLIHGGAGAVGMFAIQLAHSSGAHVLTTVSARDFDFARELGADEVLDYRGAPFESVVSNIDVVFDGVGGETLQRSPKVLNQDGRIVTIAADAEHGSDELAKQAFFIVEPNHQQLVEVAEMLDSGRLKTAVDTVLPLSRASEAYAPRPKGRGKIVVQVA